MAASASLTTSAVPITVPGHGQEQSGTGAAKSTSARRAASAYTQGRRRGLAHEAHQQDGCGTPSSSRCALVTPASLRHQPLPSSQVAEDDWEHRDTYHAAERDPKYGAIMPATVRSILGNVCRKLSKDVRRELLLRRLEERDEHMRADHEQSERLAEAFIQSLVERVRQGGP